MKNTFIRKQAKRNCNSDAVIGTKAGSFGKKKASVIDYVYGVFKGIVRYTFFCHADHIHVRLQNHFRCTLVSNCSRLVNDDIT